MLDILETSRPTKGGHEVEKYKKIGISLPQEVLEKLDTIAGVNGLSRSGMISILTSKEYLNYLDVMTQTQAFKDFSKSRQKDTL